MKYLLDTHVLIWYLEDSPKLPQEVSAIIDDPEAEACVSIVSLWEIAIKINLGKLKLNMTLDEVLYSFRTRRFAAIHIMDEHLLGLTELPYIHKDPFDRLLISTAITHNLTIITADENIQKYDVEWAW